MWRQRNASFEVRNSPDFFAKLHGVYEWRFRVGDHQKPNRMQNFECVVMNDKETVNFVSKEEMYSLCLIHRGRVEFGLR